MKTNITKKDVVRLRKELLQYASTAQVHEFVVIAMIHGKIDNTIEKFESYSIEDLNSMYRVIYKVIGKDFSDYD